MLASQMMLTTMIISYTVMRQKGFRLMPFGASKLPAVGGLILAGAVSHSVGLCYSRYTLGNRDQLRHLMVNSSAIKSGTMPFDAVKE